MPAPLRHALVVASDVSTKGPLPHLFEAARGLSEALTDPAVGACLPALSDAADVIDELSPAKIRSVVEEAIERAGESRAMLVLAFLGHGFALGGSLYFMGKNSVDGIIKGTVDLTNLIVTALNYPNIEGLLVIVDTCEAGAAPPSKADIISGSRSGRTRFALLMGAAADQNAYGMRFTSALIDVLRRGVDATADPDGHDRSVGRFLGVQDVVPALREAVPGQSIGCDIHDFDPYGVEPWLANNRRYRGLDDHAAAPSVVIGRVPRQLGRTEVQAVTRLVLAIPAFRDLPTVRSVVAALPANIADMAFPAKDRWLDIPRLIHSFEDHPELQPWRLLLAEARRVAGDSRELNQLEAKARQLKLA